MSAARRVGTSRVSTAAADAASRGTRAGMRVLVTVIAVLLAGVITAPIALSSQDIVAWAGSPDGLGLSPGWALATFLALDAAAAVCVGMVVYAAWRGEPAGAFGVLVWLFAAGSAYANFRHGSRPGAPADAWWFFPAMSVAGPALLEVTVRRVRRWVQTVAGRYELPLPHFRFARWIVALPETATAWRLAVTEGYSHPADAIAAARVTRQPFTTSDTKPLLPSRERRELLPSQRGDTSSPTTGDAPSATPEGPTPTRQRSRSPRATGNATARLDRAHGDGTDPATGQPWTSRPLGQAAQVHHATAAAYLRDRRTPAADVSPGDVTAPVSATGNGHRTAVGSIAAEGGAS
jgi:hypothetical protein